MSGAGWYWTRATWRRAARGGALLALLVALGVGGAIGAAAGARRTLTSYDRLAARSNPPNAFVFTKDAELFDQIARRPEVAAASGYLQLGIQPDGTNCSDDAADYYPILAPVAGEPFTAPRPRLLKGRFADPTQPGEVVLSEQHARRLGRGLGDTIGYRAFATSDEGDLTGCGKTVIAEVKVVGVVRELLEIGAGDEPTIAATYVTPAFVETYPDAPVLTGANGFVRLKPGADDEAFVQAVNDSAPVSEEGEPLAGAVTIQGSRGLTPALDALAFGLWVLAGALAAASVVAVTVAVLRQVAAASADLRLLAALGLARRQLATAVAAPILVAVGAGLVLAIGVAAVASTVHLVGVAAAAEPDPGLDLDPPLLLATLTVAALAGLAVAAFASWRGAKFALDPPTSTVAGRPGAVDGLLRHRLPPWAAMGSSYALGPPRRGGSSVPARAAVVALGVATGGLLAVLVFGVGVTHAKTDSTVYGFGGWDGFAGTVDEDSKIDVAEVLAADPDVDAVAQLSARFKLPINGTTTNGLVMDAIKGRSGPTIVQGRLPTGTGEIALGKDTADLAGARIGSTVSVKGPDGIASLLDVVGIVAFPAIDSDALASGFLAERAAMDALGWPEGCNDEAECFNPVALSFRPGADLDQVRERLVDGGVDVDLAEPGREVVIVGEAAQVPAFGAAGVGLVAAVSLAHTLSVTVTRRRREMAVARAIGFGRRQSAGVIVAQALTLGVVGGVAGGIAGVVAGRSAWQAAARSIGIGPALPSIAALAVAVVAAVLVLSLVLSVLPALRAARTSPAAGLRSDE